MGLRSIVLAVVFASLTSFAQSPVAFKFAWTPRTVQADCGGIVSDYHSGSLAVTVNGVSQTVTPDPAQHAAFDSSFTVARGDAVQAVLTTPDGRKVTYDDVLGAPDLLGFVTTAAFGTYVDDPSIDPSEGQCAKHQVVNYSGGAQ